VDLPCPGLPVGNKDDGWCGGAPDGDPHWRRSFAVVVERDGAGHYEADGVPTLRNDGSLRMVPADAPMTGPHAF